MAQRRVSAPSDPSTERPLTFTERWWAVTERSSDVLGEVPELGGVVYPERREHFRYSMFGVPSLDPLGDFQQDGAVGIEDLKYYSQRIGRISTDPAYAQRADRDMDGTVDAVADHQGFTGEYGLSQYKGSYSSSGLMIGYTGAVWDPAVGLWLMRHRWLDPEGGRWLTRDPAGYVDGMSLYGYVGQRAWTHFDPWGLTSDPIIMWHHMFPQQFKHEFKEIFKDMKGEHGLLHINKAASGMLIDSADHYALHAAGWNDEWMEFILKYTDNNTLPTPQQTLVQLNKMKNDTRFKGLLAKGTVSDLHFRQWNNKFKGMNPSKKLSPRERHTFVKLGQDSLLVC